MQNPFDRFDPPQGQPQFQPPQGTGPIHAGLDPQMTDALAHHAIMSGQLPMMLSGPNLHRVADRAAEIAGARGLPADQAQFAFARYRAQFGGHQAAAPLAAQAAPGGGHPAIAQPAARPRPVSQLPRRADGPAGPAGPVVRLTPQAIDDLTRTLATEWNGRDIDQGRAIIDTILNRQASGHWGRTLREVVDYPQAFSNVNGSVAWRRGGHSVADVPARLVTQATRDLVNNYLAQRAQGTPSIVGSNLNYANPTDPHISARNRVWIDRLDGPTFGHGRSIHRHGTTPDNERYRPDPYRIELPGE